MTTSSCSPRIPEGLLQILREFLPIAAARRVGTPEEQVQHGFQRQVRLRLCALTRVVPNQRPLAHGSKKLHPLFWIPPQEEVRCLRSQPISHSGGTEAAAGVSTGVQEAHALTGRPVDTGPSELAQRSGGHPSPDGNLSVGTEFLCWLNVTIPVFLSCFR